jgi:hypothetical protein
VVTVRVATASGEVSQPIGEDLANHILVDCAATGSSE